MITMRIPTMVICSSFGWFQVVGYFGGPSWSQVLLDRVGLATVRARLGSLALDPLARTL